MHMVGALKRCVAIMRKTEQSSPAYLIIGASSGIGAATARLAAERGARVILGARRRERCESIAREIRASGAEAEAVSVDVGDEQQLERAVHTARECFGQLDGAVNNAAGLEPTGAVTELDAASVERLLRVNVLGVLLGMKHQIPAMKAGSAIVNVASIVAQKAFPGTAAYTASKAAVIGLSRVAAAEVAPRGIRVNVVSPGPIVTDMAVAAFGGESAIHASVDATFATKAGTSEDVAATIHFLLSADSRHLNGEELVVDGGYIL